MSDCLSSTQNVDLSNMAAVAGLDKWASRYANLVSMTTGSFKLNK